MKIFNPSTKETTKSSYVSNEDKLKREIKAIHRWRVFWRTATVILLAGLLFTGYMNIKVNNEITVLKTKIETENALRATESNATASSTPETIKASSPLPKAQ